MFRWLKEFIELRGPSVLANVLHTINHRTVKREGDAILEAEIVKCMRHVVNYPVGVPYFVFSILMGSSLVLAMYPRNQLL